MNSSPDVPAILEAARKTFEERGKVYGHGGFAEHGQVLRALFPDGLLLSTAEEFSRFVLFNNLLTKFCRYAHNLKAGGHRDSVHDMGVYAFILEAYDANCDRS
jgi:hypothetical protein